jgi:hypothetical protein
MNPGHRNLPTIKVKRYLAGICLRHRIAESAASVLGLHVLGEGVRPPDCWKTSRQAIR